MNTGNQQFEAWHRALAERHLQVLNFREVRKAVQALSTLYIGDRRRLDAGRDLDAAGKRAAFALYFGPLHFLTVRRAVRELGMDRINPRRILDLGCGTGVAGSAWAIELGSAPQVRGVDRNPWAVAEARWNLQWFGLTGTVSQGDLTEASLPPTGDAVVCAYTLNECPREVREAWLNRALRASRRGLSVLVVEPIATRIAGWLAEWEERFAAAGGGLQELRFTEELPEMLALLDRASGLDHRSELTCRTLSLHPSG